jgi:FkbM family methyltransferase
MKAITSGILRLLARKYRAIVPSIARDELWLLRQGDFRSYARRLERYCRIAGHCPIAKVRTGHASLHVDVRDVGVGQPLFEKKYYERRETAYFSTIVSEGMTVIDVGANLGYYTTLISKLVGPTGKVFAFEPDQRNLSLLRKNVTLNNCRNVGIFAKALGANKGKSLLYQSANNLGDHHLYETQVNRSSVSVDVDTLDNLLFEDRIALANVVKMDVQGYEYYVALGMSEMMKRAKEMVVLSEFWPHGLALAKASPRAFIEFFRDRRFHLFMLDEDAKETAVTMEQLFNNLKDLKTDDPDEAFVTIVLRK